MKKKKAAPKKKARMVAKLIPAHIVETFKSVDIETLPEPVVPIVQAVASGEVSHIVFNREPEEPKPSWWSALGDWLAGDSQVKRKGE